MLTATPIAALHLDDARFADLPAQGSLPVAEVELDITHAHIEETTEFEAIALESALVVECELAPTEFLHGQLPVVAPCVSSDGEAFAEEIFDSVENHLIQTPHGR